MTAQPLPPRPDLDQLKRQAKELLRREPGLGRLRDAQRVIAGQYGFTSWDRLRAQVRALTGSASAEVRPRTRRGLAYDDGLPGEMTIVRGPLTGERADELVERGVTGVKIQASVAAGTFAHLARIATIRRVDLSGLVDLVDRDLAFLEAMPWVTAVSLARCERVGDGGVGYLRRHGQLEEVNLQWTSAGDGSVTGLAGKPALHRIALGSGLTDNGVAGLREWPALRAPGAADSFLAISSSTSLTDRALEALGDLAGVVALDVSYSVFGSRRYTAAGVAHLQRMTRLEELNFLGDLATDPVLREIAGIPRLRVLACQDMVAGDDGFRALGRCATLESIWGRHCHRVTDRGFVALGGLRRLRSLALGGRRVTDAALESLVDLPELTDLQPIMFGDEAFQSVARMPRLAKLTNMYNRDTTDAATRYLRGHPRLAHYGAHGTQITDESLRILADLPALEMLEFVNCDRITDTGLLELTRAPRLCRLSVGSCIKVSGSWVGSFKGVETSFDPAHPGYVDQIRFWTLLDYPDLTIPDVATVPRAEAASPALLSDALVLGCRAEPREDGLHLTANPGQRLDRLGVVTRGPIEAPVRIDVVVAPVEEARLHIGRAQLIFDEQGFPQVPVPWPTALDPRKGRAQAQESAGKDRRSRWTRVTVEIDRGECRLWIDRQLRHTWQDDFSDWRSRLAVGPRRSKVIVRELTVESLP